MSEFMRVVASVYNVGEGDRAGQVSVSLGLDERDERGRLLKRERLGSLLMAPGDAPQVGDDVLVIVRRVPKVTAASITTDKIETGPITSADT